MFQLFILLFGFNPAHAATQSNLDLVNVYESDGEDIPTTDMPEIFEPEADRKPAVENFQKLDLKREAILTPYDENEIAE